MEGHIDPSTIPLNRPLERHEVEAYVAALVWRKSRREGSAGFQPGSLANVDSLGDHLGLRREALNQFAERNRALPYSRWYNEFIHTLMSLGVIVRNWDQSGADFYKVSERGEELLADVSRLGDETTRLFLESLRDEELRSRCQDSFLRAKHVDTLVREACVILEDRIRNSIGADATLYGVNLVNQAFRPSDGKLVVSDNSSEQEGVHRLFLGTFGFFANPIRHQLLADLPVVRARETIGFIDILLQLLSEAKRRDSVT